MPKVPVYDAAGEVAGEIELSEQVFGAEVNEALLHQAVVMYLANRRQGSASTKTRAEARGGGRKPWRQKGTGRARHGSIRSPIWRGGGVTFGPRPRDFGQKMPKKARRQALVSALSSKVRDDELVVLESLQFETPKTREITAILSRVPGDGTALIVLDAFDQGVFLSARNIPGVSIIDAGSLNAYEVLAHRRLLLTRNAVGAIEEGLGA